MLVEDKQDGRADEGDEEEEKEGGRGKHQVIQVQEGEWLGCLSS